LADAQAPLRVLLTGDSITHGRHGDYTWRYRLYREFQRQGVPVDFVGSKTSPYVDPGFKTSSYADPNFDQNHFAQAGATLQSMVTTIGPEMNDQHPDLVVLEAGLNDFLRGRSPEDTALSLRAWIANVEAAEPDVRIVLADVMRIDVPGRSSVNTASAAYDAMLPDIAAQMSTYDSQITVADTDQGWQPTSSAYTVDGIHPAPTGETNIAQRVAEALRDLGVLPDQPQVFKVVPWSRTARPSVKMAGTVATVSWSLQAISGARIQIHRIGRTPVTSSTAYTSGTHTFTLAPGATYDFRLQLERFRETGPWGPATRVSVPAVRRPAAPRRVSVNATGVHWSASAGARSYVVKFHKAHQKRWTTRRTGTLQVLVKKVAVAKVRAVNAGGYSAWHRARR
jgi:lysophospholipase L1-like esterase